MAKKPVRPDHELPPRARPPHPDQTLPGDEDETEDPPHPDHELPEPRVRQDVGWVLFEDVAGGDNGTAYYACPLGLRERVLVWRHKQHEQNHVTGDGVWVYRQTHTAASGALERDADLKDESPDA